MVPSLCLLEPKRRGFNKTTPVGDVCLMEHEKKKEKRKKKSRMAETNKWQYQSNYMTTIDKQNGSSRAGSSVLLAPAARAAASCLHVQFLHEFAPPPLFEIPTPSRGFEPTTSRKGSLYTVYFGWRLRPAGGYLQLCTTGFPSVARVTPYLTH